MAYAIAVSKAWEELKKTTSAVNHTVLFLADEYNIDTQKQEALSAASGVPAKEYVSILVLHYLSRALSGLPPVSGEWVSFPQLPGGQGYYPTFQKRVIDRILSKYKTAPRATIKSIERLRAKKTELADCSFVFEVFAGVQVLITLWRGDDEFGPEANIHFDKSVQDVFCTEDIVVLSEIIAAKI
ncbi:MAG: DUF3786 domain-containing protein [Candidatus Omnitrophica bacterium]|nr:DUF3786 domain-containing protein [Candidatus Omnitrophota bacterium]